LQCRFGDPLVLNVFRDVSLAQLTAMFLYEMSKLLTEDSVERVNLKYLLSDYHMAAYVVSCLMMSASFSGVVVLLNFVYLLLVCWLYCPTHLSYSEVV